MSSTFTVAENESKIGRGNVDEHSHWYLDQIYREYAADRRDDCDQVVIGEMEERARAENKAHRDDKQRKSFEDWLQTENGETDLGMCLASKAFGKEACMTNSNQEPGDIDVSHETIRVQFDPKIDEELECKFC